MANSDEKVEKIIFPNPMLFKRFMDFGEQSRKGGWRWAQSGANPSLPFP